MISKIQLLIIIILFFVSLISGSTPKTVSPEKEIVPQYIKAQEEISNDLYDKFDDEEKKLVTDEFLDWMKNSFGEESIITLNSELKKDTFSKEAFYTATGNSFYVLKDMYSGVLDKNNPNYRSDIRVIENAKDTTVIKVVGDFSLADNWVIYPALKKRNKGIYGILSEETVKSLKSADITLVNNEFTFSKRGSPIKGKAFTFRANPENIWVFKELGVDIVSLANNHAYDFGSVAFADTLSTLKNSDMPYIGAGKDIEEASKPFYFIVNGRKIAFTAATKAEKFILTPEATDKTSGVMRTYNPEKYIEVIKQAETECDYNIAYVHWGTENSHKTEKGLYEMGSRFIDAGADIVIGAHAHMLQGIEYYKDIPIVYNLGNFIFNAYTVDTGILEIIIDNNCNPTYTFVPCIQKNCYTEIVHGNEQKRILEFMSELSKNVHFASDGTFTKK